MHAFLDTDRMRIVRLLSLLALASLVHAQESATPTVTASASPPRAVSLRFAPPPMEGTISLGIYDSSGKLVRVLHREDAVSEFTAGHDALETTWEGNDDRGAPLPPGKYSARGYLVGNLKIEGVAYYFNDWVTDEKSPHILRVGPVWMENDELRLDAELTGERKASIICNQTTGAVLKEIPAGVGTHCDEIPAIPNLISPIDCASGKDQTAWFIDTIGGSQEREVKQLSKANELLRRLVCPKDDPQPEFIEASTKEDKIFLVEQNERLQRLRGLTLLRTSSDAANGSVSDWKIDFEKKIITHKNFSLENGKPVETSPNEQTAPEKITQTLQPNPLRRDPAAKVDLAVGLDADGSYLKTADGLPLRTISDTPNLARALVAAHGDKAADVFQDDGAVVEQFRISGLDQMMAFDCGDIELK